MRRIKPLRVVILGAGGPVGGAVAAALSPPHRLRLGDRTAIDSEHEFVRVDVTDYEQVAAALTGQQVAVDLTVQRCDPREAFRVNMAAMWNVCRAALDAGVTRIVSSGPLQPAVAGQPLETHEFPVMEETPAHPGDDLYLLSKQLGERVLAEFASGGRLSVIHMRIGIYVQGDRTPSPGARPFAAHAEDVGQAFRLAVEAPDLARPYEVFHVTCDTPHGKHPNDKLRDVLGWRPRHNFDAVWRATD